MYQPPFKPSSKTVKSRLGLKVAALFLGIFLTVVIGLLFFDLLATFGENAVVAAATSNQPGATAIDPKLEADLAKVLEKSDAQITADIKNPFADTTGISDKSGALITSTNVTRPNALPQTGKTAVGQVTPQRNQSQQQNLSARTLQPEPIINPRQPLIETKNRLQLREEQMKLGMDGGPEAAVFAVDDLLPVGTVGGGEGKEEVLFYSQTACRVVSFPVGARFYDGWLESMRPEGVVFGYTDQFRTPGMRLWVTSTVSKCAEKISEAVVSDQSVITGGSD